MYLNEKVLKVLNVENDLVLYNTVLACSDEVVEEQSKLIILFLNY